MRARLEVGGDRGETLLEVVVAIMILGICVLAVGSSIALSSKMSGVHRTQAELSKVLHNYAEQLGSVAYSPCSTTTPASYSLSPQPGFAPPTITVSYWTGSAFGSCPGTDLGLQKVTIAVASADNGVSDSLSVVLRQR